MFSKDRTWKILEKCLCVRFVRKLLDVKIVTFNIWMIHMHQMHRNEIIHAQSVFLVFITEQVSTVI